MPFGRFVVLYQPIRGYAVCLRTNTIEILIDHMVHQPALVALRTIASTPKGKREIAYFKTKIGTTFCNTSDNGVALSIFRLMNYLNTPFECADVARKVITLCLQDEIEAVSAITMFRKYQTYLIEEAFENITTDLRVSDKNLSFIAYLGRRSLTMTRLRRIVWARHS